ncbi:hypothetical protein [Mycobacterium sp. OTB74]|jgi:hypothetical protein|uniref:hypothetical protein n=1 Tax=Mycobacterium sp. OTB74 TaxID=1853452 RepID=UPI0024735F1E|nr:hypothetical protein [Mycobacterium sp. OTB74]MDH6247551.1 hypothetical protein [Mycobacterium sp. OTB74]
MCDVFAHSYTTTRVFALTARTAGSAFCRSAGNRRVCAVDVYDGDDLAEYVIDCNITRRNMSTGRRAMSTALVLEADGRRKNGRWKRGSVRLGIHESVNRDWENRLNECGVVLDYAPDLALEIVCGAITLNEAHVTASEARDASPRQAERGATTYETPHSTS